jgi:hypothetical protein
MRPSVRQKNLLAHAVCYLSCLVLSHSGVQAQSPVKESSPFDWLRHDAAPSNRTSGPTINPPLESLTDQKNRQTFEPAPEEPTAAASIVEPSEPVAPVVEPPKDSPAPTPATRPVMSVANHPAAKAKSAPAPQPVEQIDVINRRSVTLNELKLVSLKNSRKPIIVRPSLKGGQSLKVDIPEGLGCIFLVWTQFSEEPSEQYDGVDLCVDKKINLIN